MACSARSVVVSTKLRPPSARAQRAASVATAAAWPASLGLGNRGRDVQPGMRRVVERAADAQRLRVVEPGRLGEPRQPLVVAERRRREHPGLGRQRHLLAQRVANVQRRLDQPRLVRRRGRSSAPCPRRAGRANWPALAASSAARSEQLREVGRAVGNGFERLLRSAAGRLDAREGGHECVVAGPLVPAQLERSADLAQRPGGGQTQARARRARSAAASSCHGCRPRACCSPAPSRSRAKSMPWALPSVVPRKATPASASWCASSNTATSTLGSSSATPVSRRLMSAKNRWWFTTTRSAAIASRRAFITWQPRYSGHSAPRQFSRDEVTSGITLERSSSPSTSARSPLAVTRAHCSIRASARTAQRSGSCAS